MLFFSPIFRLYAWRDLKAFIPTGNQAELFLCQFSPTPQFRRALFLTPSPQWRICPRSLCPPLTSFFDCSLSCRQHAAYANTRSFIPETPPLNECNLKWGHTCTHLQRRRWRCGVCVCVGGLEHGNMHVLQSVDLHALSDMQSLKTSNADSFKSSRQEYVVSQIILSVQAVYPDWRRLTDKTSQAGGCWPPMYFLKTAYSVICAERGRRSAAAHVLV